MIKRLSLVLLVLVLIATGCEQEQKREDEAMEPIHLLTVAIPEDVISLDPQETLDTHSLMVSNMIYSRLFKRNENDSLVPDLVDHWEHIDATTYEFFLREDAYFHNGDPVTADDVIYTLNRIAERDQWSALTQGILVDQLEKTGSHSFKLYMAEPRSSLIAHLEHPAMGIMNHRLKDDYNHTQEPVGCGPYYLERWDSGDYLVLERSPFYYGEKPYNDGLFIVRVPDQEKRLAGIKEGSVHVALDVDVDNQSAYPNTNFIEYPTLDTYVLGINETSPALEDPAKRQALNFLTDTEALEEVMPLKGVVHGNILPLSAEYVIGMVKMFNQPEDGVELWKGHLQDEDGSLSVVVLDDTPMTALAEELKRQWQQADIELHIIKANRDEYYDLISEGEHPLFIAKYRMFTDDPDDLLYNRFYSLNTGLGGNWTYTKDARVDELLLKGRQNFMPDERQAAYHELQELLHLDNAWVFMWERIGVVGIGKDVKGFQPHYNGFHSFQYVTVEEVETE